MAGNFGFGRLGAEAAATVDVAVVVLVVGAAGAAGFVAAEAEPLVDAAAQVNATTTESVRRLNIVINLGMTKYKVKKECGCGNSKSLPFL
jgi:hypothetical protein